VIIAIPDQRRSIAFPGVILVLAMLSICFYYRQNFAGQIGGEMSVAKLLWLDYALLAWFVVPFFLWRSPLIESSLRKIYGSHLLNFATRGAVELWMLYVTISWLPPYGIIHDLFSIGLITGVLWRRRKKLGRPSGTHPSAARRVLVSIRLGRVCVMTLAWLFYRATGGQIGIYFASDDPHFAFINNLTWVIVLFAYSDLLIFLWRARGIFLLSPDKIAVGSYAGTSG
jgi:hypothetical protein